MQAIQSSFIMSVAGLALALTVASCQKDGGGKPEGKKEFRVAPPSTGGPGTPEGTEAGGDDGDAERLAVAATMALSLGLVDAGTPVQDMPTYPDVAPIINRNCTQCHQAGFVSPVLATFPFTAVGDDSLAVIVSKIADRISDASRPMPPQGLIDPALRAQLVAWIDAGYPAAPTTRSGLSFAGYDVEWRQRLAASVAADSWTVWQQIAASEALTLALGTQAPGVSLDIELKVVGPRGGVQATKALTLAVPDDGRVSASLIATAEDQGAPMPGSRGELNIRRAIGIMGFEATWDSATDDITAAAELEYQVYVANGDVIKTVAEMLEHGTAIGGFSANITQVLLADLPVAAPVFVNVLVRDSAGNQAAYTSRQIEVAPVVPTETNLVASAITDRSLILTWSTAFDDTPAQALRYRVVSSNGQALESLADMDGKVIVRDFTAGTTTLVVRGLNPTTTYTFNVQVQDANGNRAAYSATTITTLATPANDPAYDILTYGKECAERLGELQPFSCLDGEIIPITVNGVIPAGGYPAFGPGGDRQQDCDKPALLGLGSDGHCPPYARLGRLKSFAADGSEKTDVETAFICRRYKGRFGPQTYRGETMDASVYPAFEDVAIVQHDNKTGETCWFQMLAQSSPKDARRVPPPTEVALPEGAPAHALSALDFWLSPSSTAGINCLNCHDSDPFIHTPYVDQVRLADGRPMVPERPFGPYKMLGRQFFTRWMNGTETGGARSYAVTTADGNNSCTSCHRIGSQNTCRQFLKQSVGITTAADVSAFGASEYALRYWMPPTETPDRPVDATAWHNNVGGYKEAAEKLLYCCNNPTSPECKRTPVNDVPPPFAG